MEKATYAKLPGFIHITNSVLSVCLVDPRRLLLASGGLKAGANAPIG